MRNIFPLLISLGLVACSTSPTTVPTNPDLSSATNSSAVTNSSGVLSSSSLAVSSSGEVLSSSVALSSSSTIVSSSSTGPGTLTLDYTPITNGGQYAPKNIYAVWVTDAQGNWVANLGARAGIRYTWLKKWYADYKKKPTTGVDGVTGATTSSFQPFSFTGSAPMTTAGEHIVHMEFTTGDVQGPYNTISFNTANGALDTTLNFTYFTQVHLTYTP